MRGCTDGRDQSLAITRWRQDKRLFSVVFSLKIIASLPHVCTYRTCKRVLRKHGRQMSSRGDIFKVESNSVDGIDVGKNRAANESTRKNRKKTKYRLTTTTHSTQWFKPLVESEVMARNRDLVQRTSPDFSRRPYHRRSRPHTRPCRWSVGARRSSRSGREPSRPRSPAKLRGRRIDTRPYSPLLEPVLHVRIVRYVKVRTDHGGGAIKIVGREGYSSGVSWEARA